MLRIYECVVNGHNFKLVLLAALICILCSLVSFQLYGRARSLGQLEGRLMIGVTGIVAGLGTWATHFVSMLAFEPGIPLGFDPGTTFASLAIAVVVMTSGAFIAFSGSDLIERTLGGGMVGAGIAAMHYTGMAALAVPGVIVWHPEFVVASLLMSVALGAAAFVVAGASTGWRRLCAAAAVFTLAVVSLHFTGMSAVELRFDPSVAVAEQAISSEWLAIGIAACTLLVLCIGAVGIAVDWWVGRSEAARLHHFADAAVEGLVICEGLHVKDANASFCALSGLDVGQVQGRRFADLLSPETRDALSSAEAGTTVEGCLVTADGSCVPVSIISRTLPGRGGQAALVYAIRDLREQKVAEKRIRFLAHHDALTGLPNRVSFANALEQALKQADVLSTRVAVLCIDLDHFKNVNDVYGHKAGDEVLVEAGRRMADALDDGEILARLGGDEFAIVQSVKADDADAATRLAERLLKALSPEFALSCGNIAAVGSSIGLAVYPGDGQDAERLLGNADTALYRAKSEGRGRFRCFEYAMDLQVRERHAMVAELRHAIVRDELVLHYQPQMKGSSGELVGFEALVRWIHPVRGVVPPGDFIPLAEESGQIIALGEWVLRTACREAARWPGHIKIAVNLSPVQFQQPNLPDTVLRILIETGLDPTRLEIEITETVMINDMTSALNILRRLKALGIRIAMDDFGTGYSSLATLQAFPFDNIKIDRSFVSKVETQEQAAVIVRAVLGLGRSLGIGVVAEGVETQAQLQFLMDESCDEVQGFLFGKPQTIDGFARELYGVAGDASPSWTAPPSAGGETPPTVTIQPARPTHGRRQA